jgi:hypothetical protein
MASIITLLCLWTFILIGVSIYAVKKWIEAGETIALKKFEYTGNKCGQITKEIERLVLKDPRKWRLTKHAFENEENNIKIWMANGIDSVKFYTNTIDDEKITIEQRKLLEEYHFTPFEQRFLWILITEQFPKLIDESSEHITINENRIINLLREEKKGVNK